MATRMQQRRDTAANWTSSNPTLAQGELGIETDTAKFKIGTGAAAWNSLAYFGNITGSFVGTTDTQTLSGKTLTSPMLNDPVTNYPLLKSPEEVVTVSATAANGAIQFDVLTQSVLYYTTNASANFSLNFRGNSGTTLSAGLAVGNSVTVVFLNTNGATPYYPTAFSIDGGAVTPKWQSGIAPTTGAASAIDAYTFTIIKTAATPSYTVLASFVKFA